MINAFKNLIAVDVLSGDCKLIVNGFIAERVTEREIVVNMPQGTGEDSDIRVLNLGTLQKVTLLPEKTKFRCIFANRYLPNKPDVVEIEFMKVVNFEGWIFDIAEH